MLTGKELFDCLCLDKQIRLFSGSPIGKFESLYASFNAELMHYIPAINDEAALGIITGAAMLNVKGIAVIEAPFLLRNVVYLNRLKTIINKPFLILTDKVIPNSFDNIIVQHIVKDVSSLSEFVDKCFLENTIVSLVFMEN